MSWFKPSIQGYIIRLFDMRVYILNGSLMTIYQLGYIDNLTKWMNECGIGILGITEVKLCDDRTVGVLNMMFYRYQGGGTNWKWFILKKG